MRNKSLLTLSLITIVIIVAAVVSTNQRAPQTIIEKPLLSSELKNQINDVSQIIIESQDSAVHIIKIDDIWGVMQADNYPARFDRVKKMVLDTSDLFIISEKTSNPSLFSELGVENHTDENAGSTLLSFQDSAGNNLISYIIGDTRSPNELYVRIAGTNNSYLAGGQTDVSTDPTEWIDNDLLNIADERIMQTTIEHTDGEIVTLIRNEGEEDFTLASIPEGRKARSGYFTNQPGTFLSSLTIENAKSQETFRFSEPQVKTTIKSHDGLVASISSAKIDGENYAAIEFSIDESLLANDDSTEEDDTIVIGEQDSSPGNDVRMEVDQLNEKVRNWVFIIPQPKFLLLTKKIEELTDIVEQEPTE